MRQFYETTYSFFGSGIGARHSRIATFAAIHWRAANSEVPAGFAIRSRIYRIVKDCLKLCEIKKRYYMKIKLYKIMEIKCEISCDEPKN